jgi:hypothetical protein
MQGQDLFLSSLCFLLPLWNGQFVVGESRFLTFENKVSVKPKKQTAVRQFTHFMMREARLGQGGTMCLQLP